MGSEAHHFEDVWLRSVAQGPGDGPDSVAAAEPPAAGCDEASTMGTTMIPKIIEDPGERTVKRRPDDVSKPLKGDSQGRVSLEAYYGYVSVLVRQNFPAHLAGRVEADDIVHDVLLRVWRADPDFAARSEGERLSFLRKACAWALLDTIRRFDRNKRRGSLDQSLDDSAARLEEWLVAVQSSPSQRASKHEQLLRLAQALGELPENQRRAVELRHLKRHSLAETADFLGISLAAAAGLLRRGLGTLRDRLQERG
jgi:RNA polymerase sigma-70 factor (ECF subfamily)